MDVQLPESGSEWAQLSARVNYQPKAMAEELDCPLRTLQKLTHDLFDLCPSDILNAERSLQVLRFLIARQRCKEFMKHMGFSNESHLCRQFKQAFNYPPKLCARLMYEKKL